MGNTDTQQPGQTVSPSQPAPADTPKQPVPAGASQQAPAPPTPSTPEPSDEPATSQLYKPDPADAVNTPDVPAITWTASEFIAHAKSASWYAALAMAAVVFAAGVFLITRDPVSTSVVIVAAVVFGIYGGHQPRQLEYQLDAAGLSIGKKHFGYHEFRSFSVLPEDAFSSIVFMPLKRFAVPTTIYYAPEDENKIVGLLTDRLPFEERGHDAIDRLMHRIRF